MRYHKNSFIFSIVDSVGIDVNMSNTVKPQYRQICGTWIIVCLYWILLILKIREKHLFSGIFSNFNLYLMFMSFVLLFFHWFVKTIERITILAWICLFKWGYLQLLLSVFSLLWSMFSKTVISECLGSQIVKTLQL